MIGAGGVGVHSSDGQLLSAHRARRRPSYDSGRLAAQLLTAVKAKISVVKQSS